MKGFSLIELLIVIAIVALLAAIAVPSYQHYMLKAKVSKVLTLANSAISQIQSNYSATGEFPASVTVLGVEYPSNGPFRVYEEGDAPFNAQLGFAGFGYANNGESARIGIISNDLLQNAYPLLADAMITLAIREENGVMISVCGISATGVQGSQPTMDAELSYLPQGCQCSNVNAFYEDGTLSAGC